MNVFEIGARDQRQTPAQIAVLQRLRTTSGAIGIKAGVHAGHGSAHTRCLRDSPAKGVKAVRHQ